MEPNAKVNNSIRFDNDNDIVSVGDNQSNSIATENNADVVKISNKKFIIH